MSENEYHLILRLRDLGLLEAVGEIIAEYSRACKKHPAWPKDFVHGTAIVAEEAGETVRAALNFHYENGKIQDVANEAKQTAATCLRLINHINLTF